MDRRTWVVLLAEAVLIVAIVVAPGTGSAGLIDKVLAKVFPKPPAAPTLAAVGGPGVVNLSWSSPDDNGASISRYAVYRGTSAGGETFLRSVSGSSLADRSIVPGVAYVYQVTATNSAGEGARSSEAGATPGPTPPWTVGPLHTAIVSTTFWVGEVFDPHAPDGSQVCSTYDAQWAYHWSGVDHGKVPSTAAGCAGSTAGGCDGVPGANDACATEPRAAANGFYPTDPSVRPRENPFYLDVPFDDVNDGTAFAQRCDVIPWAVDPGYAGHCADRAFSFMKNAWVEIRGPNGGTCYGQVEDAGPSSGSLYHDAAYVFGADDARPAQTRYGHAGMDVSPALNGCLGFAELNGQSDRVDWRFVDAASVPDGPWTLLVTASGVTP